MTRFVAPLIGAHMSIAGGAYRAFARGREVGCRTMQVFVKSPTRWECAPFRGDELASWRCESDQHDIRPVVAHACYLVNIASPDDALWRKSLDGLVRELRKADALGATDLVLHPGSFRGADRSFGVARAAAGARRALARTRKAKTRIAVETTAAAGCTLGGRFEEIAAILEAAGDSPRLTVCLDTGHIHAAGYDVRTARKFREVLRAFDTVIGLGRLAVIHLNDCKGPVGGHLDRQEHIGQGAIGRIAFRTIMRDGALARCPKIIETPKTDARGRRMDAVDLKTLEELAK